MGTKRVNGKRRSGEIIEHDPNAPARYSDLARARMPDDPDAELFDEYLAADIQTTLLPGALQTVLTELGAADDDSKVTVNKLENVNGQRKTVWLMESHPSGFNLSDIQEFYGPGDYQIIVYGKQPGTNYKVIHANKRVTIGASRNPKAPAAVAAVAQVNDGSQVAEAVAKALAGPLAGMTALMQTMMQKQGGSRAETLAEVKELMSIMGAGAAKQPTAIEQLMTFKAFKDLFGSGGGDTPLDAESGPWAVLLKSVENFGGPLAALVQQKLQGSAPAAEPAPAAAALPAPVAASFAGGAAMPVNNPDEGNAEMALALKLQVSILFNAAKTGADTVTYSSLIYEQAPDAVLDVLESPAWFDELCRIEPAFKDWKPWAEKCRAEVMQALAEDAAEAAQAESGVAGNSTGDVAKPLTQAAGGAKTVADGGSTPVR